MYADETKKTLGIYGSGEGEVVGSLAARHVTASDLDIEHALESIICFLISNKIE